MTAAPLPAQTLPSLTPAAGEPGAAQRETPPGVWTPDWGMILAFAFAIALLRVLYLAFGSPYNLIEDEAHYWEWSRRLDWSYYTKGPGIALLIRAATEVVGVSELAVRLPAVLASLVATLLVAALAADAARRPGEGMNTRVGFFAAVCFQLAPVNQLVGFISTIDGPYIACWAAACWAAWRALERRSGAAWLALGAAVGAGFLFKYTVLLLLPGLVLYAVLRRWETGALQLAPRWRVWAAGGLFAGLAGLAPVTIWNAQRDWPTIRHLLGHLGVPGGDMPPAAATGGAWSPLWTIEFIGMQIGLVGPALILAVAAAVWGVWSWIEAAGRAKGRRVGPRHAAPPAQRALLAGQLFLVCCAAPVLLFYIVVTLFAEAEGNWAMAAYVTLLPLAGWFAADAMREYAAKLAAWRRFPPGLRPWSGFVRRKPEIPPQILWHAAIVYGLIAGLGMLRVDWVEDALTHADELAVRVGAPLNLAPAVPVRRFMGAREMGEHAGEILDDLRGQLGQEPFIVARHYGRASLLAFYTPGRPTVYCASSRMNGRRTQYDYWNRTSLDDPALLGRPALLVGQDDGHWQGAFGEVQPIGALRGDGKRNSRPAYLGLGYTGFPPPLRYSELNADPAHAATFPPEHRGGGQPGGPALRESLP